MSARICEFGECRKVATQEGQGVSNGVAYTRYWCDEHGSGPAMPQIAERLTLERDAALAEVERLRGLLGEEADL